MKKCKIEILYGVEGAKSAKGIAVIIDVFRASSCVAYALSKGVKFIVPVATAKEAFTLKKAHPNYILMGEDRGIKIEGFDLGNSPFEILELGNKLKDKIIVHRSSQGTQCIVNANNADEIIIGSFPVAQAIANYLNEKTSTILALVAAGGIGSIEKGSRGGEDEKFAKFLKEKILGKKPSVDPLIKYLETHEGARRFLDPNIPEFPSEDFSLCLATDIFDFVPVAIKTKDGLIIKKHE